MSLRDPRSRRGFVLLAAVCVFVLLILDAEEISDHAVRRLPTSRLFGAMSVPVRAAATVDDFSRPCALVRPCQPAETTTFARRMSGPCTLAVAGMSGSCALAVAEASRTTPSAIWLSAPANSSCIRAPCSPGRPLWPQPCALLSVPRRPRRRRARRRKPGWRACVHPCLFAAGSSHGKGDWPVVAVLGGGLFVAALRLFFRCRLLTPRQRRRLLVSRRGRSTYDQLVAERVSEFAGGPPAAFTPLPPFASFQ